MIDKLLDVARRAGCDAVHPGYGFLAERAEFARAVEAAGLTFVGPPADAIEAMGDKLAARKAMQAAGVPVVPGVDAPVAADDPQLAAIAEGIGYPLLVKAAFGGGGKGMRVVDSPDELEGAVRQAASEAGKAFGDGTVFLERYLTRPRHVEIQIAGDRAGNLIHLGERECSVQRRHQKLIEEAPSPAVDEALRQRMGEAAVAAARGVDYHSVGTVEFLLDEDGSFYFLEMNTRLQVEHPVTELVYGLDLAILQLRLAAGERLGLTQADVALRGHAIELRICAEDTAAGFAPSPGEIIGLREPSGPHVRVDSGVAVGSEVTMHYDPMIAKLIVWGADRAEAIARAERALREYLVVGLTTTIPFHRAALADADFRSGATHIRFAGDKLADPAWLAGPDAALARALAVALEHESRGRAHVDRRDGQSQWTAVHRARTVG